MGECPLAGCEALDSDPEHFNTVAHRPNNTLDEFKVSSCKLMNGLCKLLIDMNATDIYHGGKIPYMEFTIEMIRNVLH